MDKFHPQSPWIHCSSLFNKFHTSSEQYWQLLGRGFPRQDIPKPPQSQKVYTDGTASHSGSQNNHHCPECLQATSARCFTNLHLAYCEVPSCATCIWPKRGCNKHPYNCGYILLTKAKAGKVPTTLDVELDKFFFHGKSKNFKEKTTDEKMAEVRKAFDHYMTVPENPKSNDEETEKTTTKKQIQREKKEK